MGGHSHRAVIDHARSVDHMTEPTFFKSAAAWRAWLAKHHDKAPDKLVGFHKAKSKQSGITYKEALDEALCFGWIDAVRRGGDSTWTIRFTPRRPKSIWSQINIKRIAELRAEGRLHEAGIAAFEARDPSRQNRYSYENKTAALSAGEEAAFRANRKAWENFSAMPPSYRRPATWWVVSAKREDTRAQRLQTLIADSLAGRRLKHLTPSTRKT
jgi:uncharacterized protein YdeI (YjbR/CyaY-like superfamily)